MSTPSGNWNEIWNAFTDSALGQGSVALPTPGIPHDRVPKRLTSQSSPGAMLPEVVGLESQDPEKAMSACAVEAMPVHRSAPARAFNDAFMVGLLAGEIMWVE